MFLLFFILFLFFFFSGAQNLWRHSRIPSEKSAHSELALFALYWLVVTFPCGIVHILVMIRLRVVFGRRRVGQVLPSYQNRQISALVSSLFSFLSSPKFYKCLSLFSRFSPLAVPSCRSRVFPGRLPFFLGNNAHSEKVCSSPGKRGAARAAPLIP